MNGEKVLKSFNDGIKTITINREKKKGAIDGETNVLLKKEFDEADENPEVRAVILTSAGLSFCSGADLTAAANETEPEDAHTRVKRYNDLILSIINCRKPVIAKIRGIAAGFGLSLAMGCDIRLASEDATFCAIFVRRGLIPDGGGTYFLPRLVGMGRAMELAFNGDFINAPRAMEIGLINRICKPEELDTETDKYVRKLAGMPTRTIGFTKGLMWKACEMGLEETLERELKTQLECFDTEDFKEGVMAFFQKRAPEFKGR